MSMYSDRYEEDLFATAEESADAFYAEKPFVLEDILTEQAKKDAKLINEKDETIGNATKNAHSYLKKITEDPLLYCYHAGRQFWEFYCKLLRNNITSEKRRKLAVFPEW